MSYLPATMWGMSSDEVAQEPRGEGDGVEQLTPGMTGRWRVTTRRAAHIWDLDEMTYTRLPGAASSAFAHDGATASIRSVERWPQVGSTSFAFFDDPDNPLIEQWRISSTIRRIEPADQSDRNGASTGPSKSAE